MLFPKDSITYTLHTIAGSSTTTVITIPSGQVYTILHAHMDKSSAQTNSMDELETGGNVVLEHVNQGQVSDTDMNYRIQGSETLNYITQGQSTDHHYLNLTYVPYDILTKPDYIDTGYSTAFTTTLLIIVSSLLLLDLLRRLFIKTTR